MKFYINLKVMIFIMKIFRKKIKTLKNKGFLLAICSKNNEKKSLANIEEQKNEFTKKRFYFLRN